MKEIGIDIETYSSRDLTACGVYKYVEAPDFEVLLFGYCVDGGPVKCVDLASGEELSTEIRAALTDPAVIKTAFNATFERICLSKYLGLENGYLDPRQWRCTMAAAARAGYPLTLAQCADALGIEEGKMKEGRALIRYFSCPCKVTRGGVSVMRKHKPEEAPDKWATFRAYNIRDVEVEQAILRRVRTLSVPTWEQRLYEADQEINDRGVLVDNTGARACFGIKVVVAVEGLIVLVFAVSEWDVYLFRLSAAPLRYYGHALGVLNGRLDGLDGLVFTLRDKQAGHVLTIRAIAVGVVLVKYVAVTQSHRAEHHLCLVYNLRVFHLFNFSNIPFLRLYFFNLKSGAHPNISIFQ